MAPRSYANMRAFIVTPFGKKRDAKGNQIDFDKVLKTLIEPALEQLGLKGGTTGEVIRAGSIHADMFQLLLTADLVVAEISIHNANVFYELGIRHALRQHRTFMLRGEDAKGEKNDKPPFDIQGLRYLKYKRSDPAASLGELVQGLRETLDSPDRDSPVFRNLPALREQARSNFIPVPREFSEEVTLAERARHVGDLAMLALETRGFEWWDAGLRVVGNAQFRLRDFEGARQTWEEIRKVYPNDKEANTWLGTVYQRLAEKAHGRALADELFARSDQALNFVAAHPEATPKERAEAFALQGRNAKTRWIEDWRKYPEAERRREQALRSPYLQSAYEAYANGFNEDLNHFYSGLNALAMVSVRIGLADAMPKVWNEGFKTDAKASVELDELKESRDELGPSVGLSINATISRLKRESTEADPELLWARISYADHCFLTSVKPDRVKSEYLKSLAGVPPFASDSAARQIILYKELSLFPDNVAAALEGINAAPEPEKKAEGQPLVILFTGHRVDDRKRKKKRFPPDKASVAKAKAAIRKAVREELQKAGGLAVGIAGGASGGDILFHEVCEELGVPTHLYLALPRQDYVRASVQPSGDEWVERFNTLYTRNQNKREMAWSEELPAWLREKAGDYTIWQRNNLWTLSNALALDAAGGGTNVVLIALWDKETKGDGPGGTQDMVTQAEARGARKRILYTKKLFGLEDDEPRPVKRAAPAKRTRKG